MATVRHGGSLSSTEAWSDITSLNVLVQCLFEFQLYNVLFSGTDDRADIPRGTEKVTYDDSELIFSSSFSTPYILDVRKYALEEREDIRFIPLTYAL
jgi:hypothetical protein